MQLTGPSNKIVVTANGTKLPASNTALLPTCALFKGAREAIVVPGMSQRALTSVATLANNGYTTVLLPGQEGANVFHADDVDISSTAPPAALGTPTRATLLTAAQNGNLITFPGMTPENISRHFPESDETQKGHMKQTKQGVRSTKIVDEDAMLGFKQQPGVKHKDVYLMVFDATKKLLKQA